jgi:beta-lactam-binding protein with PASTA domain
VIGQSPPAGILYPRGSTIEVILGPITAAIPAIPQGATLASYEALLRRYGFTNFTTKPDGVDLNIPPNTVSRVNPTPGTAYDVTKVVTIYVKNDTFVTPAASPTP